MTNLVLREGCMSDNFRLEPYDDVRYISLLNNVWAEIFFRLKRFEHHHLMIYCSLYRFYPYSTLVPLKNEMEMYVAQLRSWSHLKDKLHQ